MHSRRVEYVSAGVTRELHLHTRCLAQVLACIHGGVLKRAVPVGGEHRVATTSLAVADSLASMMSGASVGAGAGGGGAFDRRRGVRASCAGAYLLPSLQ